MKKSFIFTISIFVLVIGSSNNLNAQDSKIEDINPRSLVDHFGNFAVFEEMVGMMGKRKYSIWDVKQKKAIGDVLEIKNGEFPPTFKLSIWNGSPYFQVIKQNRKGDKFTLKIFDLEEKAVEEYELAFRQGTFFAFSPDRQHLAVQNDTNIYIMNLYPSSIDTSGKFITRYAPTFTDTLHNGSLYQPRMSDRQLYSVNYSSNGRYIAAPIEAKEKDKKDDTGIIMLNVNNGESLLLKNEVSADKYKKIYPRNLVFSASKYICLNYGDKKVLLYDAESLSLLRTIDVGTNAFKESKKRSDGQVILRSDLLFSKRKVSTMTFSPDEKYLFVSYNDDLLISVFRLETGEEVYLFGKENCGVSFSKLWFANNSLFAMPNLQVAGTDPETMEKCGGIFIYDYARLKENF